MSFRDITDDKVEDILSGIKKYIVFKENPINSKYLGLQRSNSKNNWQRTRVIVPKFRGPKIIKMYSINEYCLMSQLTFGKYLFTLHLFYYFLFVATLPQSGFEWNINDIVLNMWPFSNLLGILELLVTFSVGARLVLNKYPRPIDTMTLSSLVQNHKITACILHSSYLLDLIKSQVSLGSLEKILYTEQPIHRNIVNVFRKKYNINNCRYGYCKFLM